MKALVVQALTGPDGVMVAETPEPSDDGAGVVIDVVAAGVSFPDLLKAKGMYQVQSEPPYVPGTELAGIVRSAPAGSGFAAGDRVCAFTGESMAEVAVAAPHEVFHLPDHLGWDQGAALVMNYQTAVYCMIHRAGLSAGESVLILGASGGVGTSGIQVAKGVGASRVIGLVSTGEKGQIAADAGADDVVVISDNWKDEVLALTGGRGVDLVYDPVGGDRFLDGVRCLATQGRLVIVGFASGTIPAVKVNRLLIRNVSIVGAAWGEAVAGDHQLASRIHEEMLPMITAGAISPLVGNVRSLDEGQAAFRLLDDRQAVGKVVLQVQTW